MKYMYCYAIVLISLASSYGKSTFPTASVEFALNFFRTAYNLYPHRNCVLSPIAIQRSLTLLQHTARADVSKQMGTLLRLADSFQSPQNDFTNHALEMITKVFHSQTELKPDLLSVLQAEYDVDVQALDFSRQESIIHVINNWTSRFTNGIVDNVFSSQGLSDDANLVMINTLTLNASWEAQFSPRSTAEEPFNFVNAVRSVKMMWRKGNYGFADINDVQILEVPFEWESDLSMLIMRSEARPLANVIENFNLNTYRLIDERLRKAKFELQMPKFSISTGLEAKEILDVLGLSSVFSRDAFDVFANFSSKLANVYQVLTLDIDENGLQAAAATQRTEEMAPPIPKPPPPSVTINGPFMFMIRRRDTKDIIFIGHYSKCDE